MLRWNLILTGAPIGLALGLAFWLTAGGASANIDKLAPVTTQVNSLRSPQRPADQSPSFDVADLRNTPIFALTVGPGAVKEPSVVLEGISVSARRMAALISLDGRPAEWMAVGDTRDGITLQQVRASRVVIDTVFGSKDIGLGEQRGSEPVAETPPPDPNPVRDRLPPGFRSPVPPASAPK